jgi:hypothetical protein
MIETSTELLSFFKAFSDPLRLKVAGQLADGPRSAEELAAQLRVPLAQIARHTALLSEGEWIRTVPRGDTQTFALRLDRFHALAAQAMPRGDAPVPEDELPADEFDRRVLKGYLREDGSLKEIPLTPKKQLAILRHIVKSFEPERRYTEKQVNETLQRFHRDTASLRRYLIDYQFFRRTSTGSEYWRAA